MLSPIERWLFDCLRRHARLGLKFFRSIFAMLMPSPARATNYPPDSYICGTNNLDRCESTVQAISWSMFPCLCQDILSTVWSPAHKYNPWSLLWYRPRLAHLIHLVHAQFRLFISTLEHLYILPSSPHTSSLTSTTQQSMSITKPYSHMWVISCTRYITHLTEIKSSYSCSARWLWMSWFGMGKSSEC